MAVCDTLVGKYVDLCPAEIDDAEFTLKIRQDPIFTKYLPRIDNTLEQQREWLGRQKYNNDYFFIVKDKQGNRLGTCGIYNIAPKRAEVGRLALRGNAIQNLEAQLILFGFGFEQLKLEEEYGYIYEDNLRNQRCIKQFGGELQALKENGTGRRMYDMTLKKNDFFNCRKKISAFIYRTPKNRR